ncbi:hypothetical protein HDU97_003757 [Phlyctochytrium planicorne]|nr:hypothetical protein HDU97_003757 [Phlyctochytrium planicorne]
MKATFFALAALVAAVAADSYGYEKPAPVPSSKSDVAPGPSYVPSTKATVPTTPATPEYPKKDDTPEYPKKDDTPAYKPKDDVPSTKAPVPTEPAYKGKDSYGAPPPVVPSTKAPVPTTPVYTPECPGEPTATPTPKYLPTSTKAPVATNIVYSGADSLKASAFVAAAAGVAALFL